MSRFSGVNIVLHGPMLSGKTAILHIIGKALQDAGLNVEAVDDLDGRGKVFSEFSPMPIFEPDDRLISISTSLV